MNNNDILKRLHTNSENILPSDALDPEAIERSLVGVKRKNNKKILTSVCLFILTICISTMILAKPSNNDILTPTGTANKEVESKTSYEDIYKIIKKLPKKTNLDEYSFGVADGTTSISENKTSDYSETNIQVEGVDEGDVVKTNGEYIFNVEYKTIYISKANNGNPEKIKELNCDFEISVIYINDNKLFAIGTNYPDDYGAVCYSYAHIGNGTTRINIFDLSDISKPVKESDFTLSGNYISSRKIGNIVYLNTSYCVWNDSNVDENKPETYCPTYICNERTYCIDEEDIIISNTNYDEDCLDYTTIISIDLNNPTKFADMEAVFGAGSGVYSTPENYYVYSSDHTERKTEIHRFEIKNGTITDNGTFETNGTTLNQFAIDEYNVYLRTVTQKYDKKTKSYISIISVFNSDTELVGQLEIPTGKETIRSVRFDENIAYFVTFETTDPLFTVDLSNPEKPKIISELKITGFSKYLHEINDKLLFGFGEKTSAKGRFSGLKLSLYDTSDKNNVTELDRLTFGDRDTWSEAEYNHKAIYIDKENNLIGIPYSYFSENIYYYSNNIKNPKELYTYGIFKIDTENKKIINITQIIYEKMDSSYSINYARGVKIGDYFYIATPHKIYSYDYKTFELINTIKLSNVDY